MTQKIIHPSSGYFMLFVVLGSFFGTFIFFGLAAEINPVFSLLGIGSFLFSFIGLLGFFTIQPNDARVVTLFGTYVGTVVDNGFFWANPFYFKQKITLRARNLESKSLKVNDKVGNPIEIGAVVVWKVEETAQAAFAVDNYERFVEIQSEAALRHIAGTHNYDSFEDEHSGEKEITLRDGGDHVISLLIAELQERLSMAGIRVLEARISHLAYASEIAGAMLQRQQALAVVAARTKIVEGAVGMVELALDKLKSRGIVDLDDERKAAMVSNLLVVLCAEKQVSPVVNSGSLY